jgi:hypothetical protein
MARSRREPDTPTLARMQGRRSPGTEGFRPRGSLGLVYFFGFFFLFLFLLAAPTMWQFRHANPDDPEQKAALERAVQETVQPRLWIAVGLAVVATVAGGRLRLLPGTR